MKKFLSLLLLPFLLLCGCRKEPVVVEKPPKGAFVLVGGGDYDTSIRSEFIRLAGGDKAKIILIPSASKRPEAADELLKSWQKDHRNVFCLDIKTREQANDSCVCYHLEHATGVWISGGDQDILMELTKDTLFQQMVGDVIDRGGVVGGTSAGASALSKKMISDGEIRPGFGYLDNFIVDQHFNNRGRLNRLMKVVKENPEQVGVGIDEGTAVIIKDGKIEIMGKGSVTFCRYKGSYSVVVCNAKNHLNMIAMR